MADIEQALRAAMISGHRPYDHPMPHRQIAEPMAWPSPPSTESMKNMVQHPAFRAFAVFLVAFILLCAINPPFVNATVEGERNPLEEPPCSYGRVMISAAVFAGMVLLVPLCLKHRSKFETGFNTVKGWVDKAKSSMPTSS